MWYMLSSIRKRRLHEAGLRALPRSILAATMRDSTNSAAVRRQHGTEQNRRARALGVREGLTVGVFIGWPDHPWGDPIVSMRNPRGNR